MTTAGGRFMRENAFLVAAVALPVVVVGFFLLATAIPRLTVPPPAFDLVLRVNRPYDHVRPGVLVDFEVRDGRVVAVVRAAPEHSVVPRPDLLLFDHGTNDVREIPTELPPQVPEGSAATAIPVESLSGRRVVAGSKAPDGYEFDTRTGHGPGIVSELFGMRRYDSRAALVHRGRIVRLSLPAAYEHAYGVEAIGWVVE